MRAFTLLFCSLVAVSALPLKDRTSDLIFGGSEAKLGQWPWFVYLDMVNEFNTTVNCGGALLTKRHVLTAAHCLKTTKGTIARFGVVDKSEFNATEAQTIKVAKKILHPAYVNRGSFYDDIAIVVLESDVQLNENVQTIGGIFRNDSDLINTTQPYVCGFGIHKYDNQGKRVLSDHLLYTDVAFADQEYCKEKWADFDLYDVDLWDKQICAGSDGKGVANADSGGPLQVKVDGKWIQMGIVSMGPNYYGWVIPFQNVFPAIYTRVSDYCDFIAESTDNEFQCTERA